jgi:hypothetical protein
MGRYDRAISFLGKLANSLAWRRRKGGTPQAETRAERYERVVNSAKHPTPPTRTRKQVRGRVAAMQARKVNVARLRRERVR